jgi:hypothetical protein
MNRDIGTCGARIQISTQLRTADIATVSNIVIRGVNFIYNLMTQDGLRVLFTFNLLMLDKRPQWKGQFPL